MCVIREGPPLMLPYPLEGLSSSSAVSILWVKSAGDPTGGLLMLEWTECPGSAFAIVFLPRRSWLCNCIPKHNDRMSHETYNTQKVGGCLSSPLSAYTIWWTDGAEKNTSTFDKYEVLSSSDIYPSNFTTAPNYHVQDPYYDADHQINVYAWIQERDHLGHWVAFQGVPMDSLY